MSVQFQPFASVIEPSFWKILSQKKIDDFKLDSQSIPVVGSFTTSSHDNVPSRATFGSFSFDHDQSGLPAMSLALRTELLNCNTMTEFKALDRVALLHKQLALIKADIESGKAVQDPSCLNRALFTSFADLKTHRFIYWLAFPALSLTKVYVAESEPSVPISSAFSQMETTVSKLGTYISAHSEPVFAINTNSLAISSLHALASSSSSSGPASVDSWMLCFIDPSSLPSNPGWTLRNVLALIESNPSLMNQFCADSMLRVLAIRDLPFLSSLARRQSSSSIDTLVASAKLRSVVFHLKLSPLATSLSSELAPASDQLDPDADVSSAAASSSNVTSPSTSIPGIGWERNERNKMGPRLADLSRLLDPAKLAEDSVDLNLKLMRWRILPDLDLDSIQQRKCLLLGAGTLGCVVARSLLAWGVRHVSLLDGGKVSFSNPVRQWLFNFEDCLQGGQPKALAAASRLRQIFPGAQVEGIELNIPMPGHVATALTSSSATIDPSVAPVKSAFDRLSELIESHDVIYLLTDSRESRWLPTLLSQHHRKLTLNAALGFDSFLVMRHGLHPPAQSSTPAASGKRLSCYFCADVVAPSDSLSDRTLDQQCTVSRPGLAPLAASLSVEVMAALLQHPLQAYAPAPQDDSDSPSSTGCLGVVPHQMRGSLSSFSTQLLWGPAFDRCIACSPQIVNAFEQGGFDFVMAALLQPKLLEDLTGLTQIKQATDDIDLDWDEDGSYDDDVKESDSNNVNDDE